MSAAEECDRAPRKRADAKRNRERLLAAARDLIAEQGMTASMEAVARRAGLGIGTLYRHFPTREALVEALYREEHTALLAAADDLAARLPPDEALAQWLQRCLDYFVTKRGLGDSLHQLFQARPDLLAAVQSGFPSTVTRLLAAAVAQGSIRADAEPEDILHALGGIYAVPAGPDWRRRAGRIVELLMDGLRAKPGKAEPPARD